MRRLNVFGMVVTSGKAIETMASVNCVAFDKTGTLTLPDATPELELEPGWRERRTVVEEMISAAENAVEHPIAKALRSLAKPTAFAACSVSIEPGLGILAEVESPDDARHIVRIVRTDRGARRRTPSSCCRTGRRARWFHYSSRNSAGAGS